MKKELYKKIAHAIGARENCKTSRNDEWFEKWSDKLIEYNTILPSGSGIDTGTAIDLEHSTEEKLYLHFSYHFMNEVGYYDGWEDYKVIITPSLRFGYDMRFVGKDRDNIKEYFHQVFDPILTEEVE